MGSISGIGVSLIASIGGVSVASITSLGGVDVASIGSWPGRQQVTTLIDLNDIRLRLNYANNGQPIVQLYGSVVIDPVVNPDNLLYIVQREVSYDLGESYQFYGAFLNDFNIDPKTGLPESMLPNFWFDNTTNSSFNNEYYRNKCYPIYGDYTTYFYLTVCAGDGRTPPFVVSVEQLYQGIRL